MKLLLRSLQRFGVVCLTVLFAGAYAVGVVDVATFDGALVYQNAKIVKNLTEKMLKAQQTQETALRTKQKGLEEKAAKLNAMKGAGNKDAEEKIKNKQAALSKEVAKFQEDVNAGARDLQAMQVHGQQEFKGALDRVLQKILDKYKDINLIMIKDVVTASRKDTVRDVTQEVIDLLDEDYDASQQKKVQEVKKGVKS